VSTNPSLDEFLSAVRREFAFLESEFGFTDQGTGPNPFSVIYRSDRTAVEVEGTQWGFGTQVMLSRLEPSVGTPRFVPLWAILQLRAPDGERVVSGQLRQLAIDASSLRRYATDVLQGDFTSFPAAMRVVERTATEDAKPVRRKLP
jgi:hypothetical protein